MSRETVTKVRDPRKLRGAALAACGLVREVFDGWLVTNEFNQGQEFRVTFLATGPALYACTCSYYCSHRHTCAHGYAVEIFVRAQHRAVEARYMGTLNGLADSVTAQLKRTTDPFTRNCLFVLFCAACREGQDMLEGVA